ncbi:hypothetical protein [Caulobacter sp. RHG1]|uniref:hypothetical protein n=1 Tax=Caulobacter sp. (strain RHG1) TaxID=2545762 RepID=UPI001552335B|nr:hypothetical protein [Caulobacter sp. RHG1]NQE63863.1 hypothetical protein [Caulobacter sp. RHG1]
MSLLIAALIGLLALTVSREPGGTLWRMLVDWPARRLGAMSWRTMLAGAVVTAFAIFAAELVIADLVWVLAFDIIGWVELFAATLLVTRLAPGWRSFRALLGSGVRRVVGLRPRSARARRIPLPAKVSDDPDPSWGLAFA